MFFSYLGLCLAPLLSNYVLYDSVSIGDFLILLCLFLFRLKKSDVINFHQLLAVGCVGAFFLMSVVIVITENDGYINSGFYRLIFYVALLLMVPFVQINYRYFWAAAETLAFIFSISLLVQFAFFQTGYVLPLKLPLSRYELDTLEVVDQVYRGGGLFREPSYFALYLFPIMLYQVYEFNWKLFSLNAVALIMSTSSLGFVIFASIIFDRLTRSNLDIKKRLLFLVFPVCFPFILLAFQDTIIISRFIDNIAGEGSFSVRVLPLIEYFDDIFRIMPLHGEDSQLLLLSAAGDIWLSSAVYFVALFGIICFLLLVVGLTYLDCFTYLLFLLLIFSTGILSTSFSIYLGIGFYGIGSLRKLVSMSRASIT